MVRTLIQPLEGRPAPLGVRNRDGQGLNSDQPLRPGIGLVIASGASLGLWAGLAKFLLLVLR